MWKTHVLAIWAAFGVGDSSLRRANGEENGGPIASGHQSRYERLTCRAGHPLDVFPCFAAKLP